jgi:hypothetical protein
MINHKANLIRNTPGSIIETLRSMRNNTETYEDSVELLRRLLLFVYEEGNKDGILWDITDKQDRKLKKLLDKVDDLLVEIQGDNR